MTDPKDASSRPPFNTTRAILLWGVPIVAIACFVAYYWLTRHSISTDNAYVRTEKTAVSAEVDGKVMSVLARENQAVTKGQLLVQLDDRDRLIALQQATSHVEAIKTEIEALKAAYQLHKTRMEVAASQAHFAENEYQRQKKMASDKLASQSDLDEAEKEYQLMRGAGRVLREQMKEILAQLGGNADLPTDQHPRVRAALAAVEQAKLQLERTRLTAPRDGIISKLPYEGDYLSVRVPAFYIVDNRTPWIEANFKETDLGRLRTGQPVEIEIDSYPDHNWEGSVESISQASGAEFAILPPQNATGNWVKVVQRIPVRIAISTRADDPPLRSGMSTIVRVDVR